MAKRWRIHPHDPDAILALERAAGVPPVIAQLLLCRDIRDPAKARAFLQANLSDLSDPAAVPGVADAASRIHAAITAGRHITIYGDYDVDGMTGTAMLLQCLKTLGADASYYVPHRIDEGYGLHSDALSTLAAQGTRLLVTVDCGIASLEEAACARQLGLELIVTDHHQFAARLPDAAAIVHPRLPGHANGASELSGCGVAFMLAWAVCQQASQSKRVGERMKTFLLQAVTLAALGTVADMVPMCGDNRLLVKHGLLRLKDRPLLGLAALLKVAELESKAQLTSEDIAFSLAPRLNAAGRLGQARLGVELLTTSSEQRAKELAEYINELNGSRQSLERSIYLAANKQAQEQFDPEHDSALVLADRGWHPGVIGIVAGRLVEKYHRPVVLISLDDLGVKPGVGSARSVPGFNLHGALAACSAHLLSFGGHTAAAGMKIDERQIDHFRAALNDYAAGEIAPANRIAELRIDAEAPLSALTPQAVAQIEQLAPFGQGNARPLVCATGVTLSEPPKRIGGGGRHLSLKLVQHGVALRGVAFGGGDWTDELAHLSAPFSIAFRPTINDFRGRRSVELQVVDWRAADAVLR